MLFWENLLLKIISFVKIFLKVMKAIFRFIMTLNTSIQICKCVKLNVFMFCESYSETLEGTTMTEELG